MTIYPSLMITINRFSLEDVESRILVHVIESPDACTHEVAVYPGKISHNKTPVQTSLRFLKLFKSHSDIVIILRRNKTPFRF